MATHGIPSSPGVPASAAADTLTCHYNDLEATRQLFALNPDSIAAIIVEPIAGNMGCVLPLPGFLEGLREICDEHGSLLIFDEVMTGFRAGPSSAQGHFNVKPDLTTLGKVIGGGLPVGAYGGRRDLMEQVSPVGPIYQAGTLSGNPLAVAAGCATLELLYEGSDVFDGLATQTDRLAEGLEQAAERRGIPLSVPHLGSMGCVFFSDQTVHNFAEASALDADRFYRFHAGMLRRGVYLAPSPFEALFLSTAHTEADIRFTLEAADEVFGEL